MGQVICWWVVLDSGETFHLVVGYVEQRWDSRSFDSGVCFDRDAIRRLKVDVGQRWDIR